jgi:hypothetical protein
VPDPTDYDYVQMAFSEMLIIMFLEAVIYLHVLLTLQNPPKGELLRINFHLILDDQVCCDIVRVLAFCCCNQNVSAVYAGIMLCQVVLSSLLLLAMYIILATLNGLSCSDIGYNAAEIIINVIRRML